VTLCLIKGARKKLRKMDARRPSGQFVAKTCEKCRFTMAR